MFFEAGGTDPDGEVAVFRLDLDGDGTFEAAVSQATVVSPNGVGAAIGTTFVAGVVFSVLPGLLLDGILVSSFEEAQRAVRESGGTALAVSDADMLRGMRDLGSREGISAAPEGGVARPATLNR